MAIPLNGLWRRPRSAQLPSGRADSSGASASAPAAVTPPQATAAGERGQHALAEAFVHEAVDDGVDAG